MACVEGHSHEPYKAGTVFKDLLSFSKYQQYVMLKDEKPDVFAPAIKALSRVVASVKVDLGR